MIPEDVEASIKPCTAGSVRIRRSAVAEDTWRPDLLKDLAYFQPLKEFLRPFFRLEQWPDLQQYQAYIDAVPQPIQSGGGRNVQVVAQAAKTADFEQRYLVRVYQDGELQTRLHNWHDFFQVLTWRVFPTAKAQLNKRHFHAALAHANQQAIGTVGFGRRSQEENLLSLFDEGGVVLLSDQPDLLQAIREFQWRRLFFEARDQLEPHLRCMVFGHALYEKLLNPYLGLTGNALLLTVPSEVLQADPSRLWGLLDARLAEVLSHQEDGLKLHRTQDLHPFPLLGLPGYWPGNDTHEFYQNTAYFRPGRQWVKGK